MDNYEIKFKKTVLHNYLGAFWILISLIWTVLLAFSIFAIKPSLTSSSNLLILIVSFNIVLGFINGIYNLTLHSRNYVKITNEQLEIHKAPLRKNQIINLKDIEEARLIGNKIILLLKNNDKEAELKADLMYVKDSDKLLEKFSKK